MSIRSTLLGAALAAALLPNAPAFSQAAAPAAPAAKPQAAKPLQLQSLEPSTKADPFPAVDPKNFTADSPTVATVDSYLHTVLGYDTNRIWRVEAIEKTASPGVSKVTALISGRTAGSKVLNATFYVMPDGHHLIADVSGVQPFGAKPYAENRALLEARANGPAMGAAGKDLLMVEFTDLQCVRCKDAQATVTRLAQDFPKARIVYQPLPLPSQHPQSLRAAEYGACVAKQKPDAFFPFVQAVLDTQAELTPDAVEDTLKAAVTKAGGDPAAASTCASTPETKAAVDASAKLAADAGIEQTPILVVNGRPVPLGALPYEMLKQIISFQASFDGVSGAEPVSLTPRAAPSLTPQ